jgi:hypothetical protein
VAKMFVREVFSGRYESAPTVTEFPNIEPLDELMIVGPMRVCSACSHPLCPIMGRVWIGVMPDEHLNLVGLSKYGRFVNGVMSRPQITRKLSNRSPTCWRTGCSRRPCIVLAVDTRPALAAMAALLRLACLLVDLRFQGRRSGRRYVLPGWYVRMRIALTTVGALSLRAAMN